LHHLPFPSLDLFYKSALRSVLNKFLDRGRKGIPRQELALELECSRDDVIKNQDMIKDTLIEIQEDRAIENCKLILGNLLAKGVELTPESLADYLGVSVREVKLKQYIFDQAVAEFREAQAVA
jgi:biotin operon repressor